ncbi:MAG: hypothetical protein Q4P32_10790 [Micrococcales bacterium]|nr:hypothetical protein [Micrococcales bacterium]
MTTTKRLLLALALVLGLVALTATGVSALRSGGSEPAPNPKTTIVETTPTATERPWDQGRMQDATPLPMPTQG